MSRRKSTKVSLEELGFSVVELPRPRTPDAPSECPSCGQALTELSSVDEDMETGDGHSYVDVRKWRGLCPSCGWVDL